VKQTDHLPDYFDSLAAINKFIAVPKVEPDFHKQHYHAIEMAGAFLRVLASNYQPLKEAFRASLPMPISEGSKTLRRVIPTLSLTEEKIRWLDLQTTEILKVLLPVVRDPSLPSWLLECKWAIEGAFS